MNWLIPAKTFLVGEYAAICGAPAILLTTSPCFELSLIAKEGLEGIHSESPAGRWWLAQHHQQMGLKWQDPYQGLGGLGASSAQFLGAYLADSYLKRKIPSREDLLETYLNHTTSEKGLKPSGYDVLAQSLNGCVYIDRQGGICQHDAWPFEDLAFILIHTGKKLATHEHLQATTLLPSIDQLIAIVHQAKMAFDSANSQAFIDAVNAYYQELLEMNLVAHYTKEQILFFKTEENVLGIKGCGAMGADVLLVLVPQQKEEEMSARWSAMGFDLIARTAARYSGSYLMDDSRFFKQS